MPAWCRCSTARATVNIKPAATCTGMGPLARSARLPPGISSSTTYRTVLFARLIDWDNVAMPDPTNRPCLMEPTAAVFLRDPDTPPDDLDGDTAVQLRLPRLVDHSHAASSKLAALIMNPGIVGGCSLNGPLLRLMIIARRCLIGEPLQNTLTVGACFDMPFFHRREPASSRCERG